MRVPKDTDLHDFRISLYFGGAMNGLYAPDGPGWYIDARYNQGEEVTPYVRLTPTEAEKVGLLIDNLVQGKKINPIQGAKQAEGGAKAAILATTKWGKGWVEKALREAEAAAQKVAELRTRLGEFE